LSGAIADGRLPVEQAIDYVLQACEALAEAHAGGVVHRDLKPENMFLARRSAGTTVLKILDFGISKRLWKNQEAGGQRSMRLTAETDKFGTPTYMSPEQIEASANVDPRADIWSLGVILHELLTGKPPFCAETLSVLLALILTQSPPPVRAVRPEVPAALEAAILRCLEKDRQRRFRNVGELAQALAPLAGPSSIARADRIVRILSDAGQSVRPAYVAGPNDHSAVDHPAERTTAISFVEPLRRSGPARKESGRWSSPRPSASSAPSFSRIRSCAASP
ncbi:MAG: serine/threonine protein kinase, partial [Myxococcales bacterium]|nr:serine/threonine protein kinase [Myxococcales bacterium]